MPITANMKKKTHKKASNKKVSQKNIDKMIIYRKGGATYALIAKDFKVSIETARKYCKGELSELSDKAKITFKYIDVSNIYNLLILDKFVQWIAKPSILRNPKTQIDFSKQESVDEDTLTNYKKLDGFWDEVRRHSYQGLRSHTADVIYGQAIKGKIGDARAAKVFLEAVEQHSSNVTITDGALTDERVAEIAKAVKNWSEPENDNDNDNASK